MSMQNTKQLKAFTLIELLLVIGIIAVLAVVVFVALDPAKRFADARDARRVTDVETILSAVTQYTIDNKGDVPGNLTTTEKQIGSAISNCGISTGDCSIANDGDCIDLSSALERYLKVIPFDPLDGSTSLTHYSIVRDANGIVTVRACDTEGSPTSISASR